MLIQMQHELLVILINESYDEKDVYVIIYNSYNTTDEVANGYFFSPPDP